MELVVHRGTNEIGASCLEVRGAGKRILLDAGLPLDDAADTLNPDVKAALEQVDALFVSHGHMDHCGLLDQVPDSVPVYMSETARQLLDASRVFRKLAPLGKRTQPLKPGVKIDLGRLSVTPRLMDHSAPDALGFHVQADGQGLFYTGDFRSHGRKSAAFEHLLAHPPKPLDALVMEGTLLDRGKAAYSDEASVETAMAKAFNEEAGLSCVVCSGQNIDRLVSVYRAAIRSNRALVLDLYTAWVLEVFGQAHSSVPRVGWDGVRVLARGRFAASHYVTIKDAPDYFGNFLRRVFDSDAGLHHGALQDNPGGYVVKTSRPLALVEQLNAVTSTTIYSLWAGNLDPARNPRDAQQYTTLADRPGARFLRIHTSGHADLATLKRLNDTLCPKTLIPMHTEHKRLFPDHFPNALVLEDGQTLTL